MVSPINSLSSAVPNTNKSFIQLIKENLEREEFEKAHNYLLLQLDCDVLAENYSIIYTYIIQILEHCNYQQFSELEEQLMKGSFLSHTSASTEKQSQLALCLGSCLLRIGSSQNKNCFQAKVKEYYVAYLKTVSDQDKKKEDHQKTVLLSPQACLESNVFKDLLIAEQELTIEEFISKLENLRKTLCCSPIEEQRQLALRLGHFLLQTDASHYKNYLQAMEYYVTSLQIASDQEKKTEGHQKASFLFLQACLEHNVFKDQVIDALDQVSTFRELISRLEDLGKTFCCSPSDTEIMKKFYEHVYDPIKNYRLEKKTPYKDCFPQIMRGIVSPPYSPQGTYPTERYRQQIDTLRAQFKTLPQDGTELRKFQTKIAQAFRSFFKQLENDLILLLGPPPCHYELRAMGSLGREEMCPFSDVELFVLLETKNEKTDTYFTRFIYFLDLQLRSLGEKKTTPIVFPSAVPRLGLEIDDGGNPATCPGLIGTPLGLASLQTNEFIPDSDLFRTVEHTLLTSTHLIEGSRLSLFTSYETALLETLKEQKEDISLFKYKALVYLEKRLKTFSSELWKTPYSPGHLDIKDKLLAALYYPLAHMALYWQIKATNTLDIIDELAEKNIFTASSVQLLKETVSAIYNLRVKTHLEANQKEDKLIPDKSLDQKLEKIYWLVLHPFYKALTQALPSDQITPSTVEKFENTFHHLDLIQLLFDEASTSLIPGQFIPGIRQTVLHLVETQAPSEEISRYFELLSKNSLNEPLRIAFLETLEGKVSSDLLERLFQLPNKSGLRRAYIRCERKLHMSIKEIITTQPMPTSADSQVEEVKVASRVSLKGDTEFLGGYLKPDVIEKIIDTNGQIKQQHPGSAHFVAFISGLYFKQKPTHPLMEYAIHNFFFRLAGDLTPASQLVRFEIKLKSGKTLWYPVLISQKIPGRTLKALEKNISLQDLDIHRFTWFILGSLLTRPGDGRLSNYIVNDNNLIFCIDNDLSFVEPVTQERGTENINICTALFCFPPAPLSHTVLGQFIGLDRTALLDGWIEDVIAKDKEYTTLFTPEEKIDLYEQDPENRFTSTILFKEGTLITLDLQFRELQNYLEERLPHELPPSFYEQFGELQTYLKKQLSNESSFPLYEQFGKPQAYLKEQMSHEPFLPFYDILPLTSYDLIQKLVNLQDMTQSVIGKTVAKAYHQTTGKIGERLGKAVARNQEVSLTSAQFLSKTFKRIPSADEVYKKEAFSPEKAREELLHSLLQHPEMGIIQDKNDRLSLRGDFASLKSEESLDKSRHFFVFNALTYLVGLKRHTCVVLRHCTILNSSNLDPFLQQTVTVLDLSCSDNIKDRDIIKIQQKCPRLKKLYLEGCKFETINKTRALGFLPDTLSFENLEELSLAKCENLRSIKIKLPKLKKLNIQGTKSLLEIDLNVQNFPCIEFEGSSCVEVTHNPIEAICREAIDLENAENFYVNLLVHLEKSPKIDEEIEKKINKALEILEQIAKRLDSNKCWIKYYEYRLNQHRRLRQEPEKIIVLCELIIRLIVERPFSQQQNEKCDYFEEYQQCNKQDAIDWCPEINILCEACQKDCSRVCELVINGHISLEVLQRICIKKRAFEEVKAIYEQLLDGLKSKQEDFSQKNRPEDTYLKNKKGELLYYLGWSCTRSGSYKSAVNYYARSLNIYKSLENRSARTTVLRSLIVLFIVKRGSSSTPCPEEDFWRQEYNNLSVSNSYDSSDHPLLKIDDALLTLAIKNDNSAIQYLYWEDRFINLIAFGENKWKEYFGEVIPQQAYLPKGIRNILCSRCPFDPDKIVAETHSLILIPEDLTLDKLENLFSAAKQGRNIKIKHKDKESVKIVLSRLGRSSSSKSRWVLMTRKVIPGSKNLYWEHQQTLAKEYKDYALPSVIDVSACLFLDYVQTGRRTYADNYTRCVESVDNESGNRLQVVVGGFADDGFEVDSSSTDSQENCGVGLIRIITTEAKDSKTGDNASFRQFPQNAQEAHKQLRKFEEDQRFLDQLRNSNESLRKLDKSSRKSQNLMLSEELKTFKSLLKNSMQLDGNLSDNLVKKMENLLRDPFPKQ